MIEVKIEDNIYLCPENWEDLTCSIGIEYYNAKINNADKSDLITILTGIPGDKIYQLSTKSIDQLFILLSFTNDESVFFNEEPKDEYKNFDYGSLQYKKTERVRQLIDVKKSLFGNSIPVFKYLFDIDLTEEPLVEWVGTLNFFLNKWIDYMANLNTYPEMKEIIHKYRRASETSKGSDHSPLVLS